MISSKVLLIIVLVNAVVAEQTTGNQDEVSTLTPSWYERLETIHCIIIGVGISLIIFTIIAIIICCKCCSKPKRVIPPSPNDSYYQSFGTFNCYVVEVAPFVFEEYIDFDEKETTIRFSPHNETYYI